VRWRCCKCSEFRGSEFRGEPRIQRAYRVGFRAFLPVQAVPPLLMAVTELRGLSPQAALSKAIKSLNDRVVRRYWAWSFEFGVNEDFGG